MRALLDDGFVVDPTGIQEAAAMKLRYYCDTDSLYIDLAERPSADSREETPGVVLDFDAAGTLVGIDIDPGQPPSGSLGSGDRKRAHGDGEHRSR